MAAILEFQKGIIDVYNGYACTTGVCSNNLEGKKWLVQNYLNYIARYNDRFDYVTFDYFYSDFTFNSSINFFQPENIVNLPYNCYSTHISEICNIIEFIQKKIDTGFFICMFVNIKYLHIYCLKEDLLHDIFIYGYDDEKQLIYSAGYVNGKGYSMHTHTYDELIHSFKNINVNSPTHNHFDTKRISYFKYRKDFTYDFSILNFTNALKEYLNISTHYQGMRRLLCRNLYNDDERIVYGIESISILVHFFENLSKDKNIDLRQIYFLYNHKINMRYKIKYLVEAKYIDDNTILDEYSKIVYISQKCLNLSIKYNLKSKEEYLKVIILYLRKIYIKESETLIKLIGLLEKKSIDSKKIYNN